MEEYKCCEVCGRPYSEYHHIVYRSQAKHMENVALNGMYLCHEHHRGNKSPHQNKKIDLQYKRELQAKLKNKFNTQSYYTLRQIKELLEISESEAQKITKTLTLHKEGYAVEEIIKRCLGGRLYEQ